MEAVRFALFAEALAPLLRDANQTLALSLPADPQARLQVAMAKRDAERMLPWLRGALRLDDDG